MGFRENLKALFERYKCIAPHKDLLTLPIHDDAEQIVAQLVPITQDFRVRAPQTAALLTKWRIENPTISTGKFVATEERTALWLDNLVVGREDRLIFMVVGLDQTPLGHIGFSNVNFDEQSGEVDSVLRGVKSALPGLMTFATKSLLRWGYREAKFKAIKLSVFSDNDSAIRFYERMGFVVTHTKALYLVKLPDEEKLEIAPEGYTGPIEKYYVYMQYKGTL